MNRKKIINLSYSIQRGLVGNLGDNVPILVGEAYGKGLEDAKGEQTVWAVEKKRKYAMYKHVQVSVNR